jgi:hypothetical protein
VGARDMVTPGRTFRGVIVRCIYTHKHTHAHTHTHTHTHVHTEEKEEEEEEGLFKADAVNEEDPERDRATQV